VEAANWDGVYELVLYQGAGDIEISRVRFAVAQGYFGNSYYVLGGTLVPAGARIRAAVAFSDGLAHIATVRVSICYHEVV
jgi:hypothetical protein